MLVPDMRWNSAVAIYSSILDEFWAVFMYCLVSPALSLPHHKERVKCALILVQSKLSISRAVMHSLTLRVVLDKLVFRTLPAVIMYIYMRGPYLQSVFS